MEPVEQHARLSSSDGDSALGVWQRLELLANLPLLINSSTDLSWITSCALEQLQLALDAEWAVVHLCSKKGDDVVSWNLGHDGVHRGAARPLGEGIVGYVISHQESVLVRNGRVVPSTELAAPISFPNSHNTLCVPLNSRRGARLGALEVRSHREERTFSEHDLKFLEQVGAQVALAIENAQLVRSLENRTKTLEELNRRRTDIITMLAHEFRTPLNVIQSAADMIASRTPLGSEMQRQLRLTLANGVQKLVRLVSEVNTLSLVSAPSLEVRVESVEIASLLESVLQPLREALTARRLALEVQSPPAGLNGNVDPALLSIALRNLLTNAIRFTPDGGTVVVNARKVGGTLICSVKDSGVGIPREHHALIFEKFYEITDVLHHSSGDMAFRSAGLGIGLATARAIVEAHGGSISVKSEPDQGSEFTIRVPA